MSPSLRASSVDPGGRWFAFSRMDSAGIVAGIIPSGNPEKFRPLALDAARDPQFWQGWSWKHEDRTYLESIHIRPHADTLPLGTTSLLFQEATSAEGRPLTLPTAVLRWRVSDTAVAAISRDGVLTPRHAGHLTIYLSAGGWRTDTLRVTLADSPPSLLSRESWTDPTLAHWGQFGDPLPRVANGPGGSPGFLNNGDDSFTSGAWSKDGWDASAGLAFETTVSTPISRAKWQRLELQIATQPALVNGFPSMGVGCSLGIPGGEGKEDSHDYSGGVTMDTFRLPIPPEIKTGQWYAVLIQIFPDATCGVAVRGVPVYRSRNHLQMNQRYHIVSHGQSVGTTMLLGPIVVWRGIRHGIDWESVDRPRSP